MWSKKAAAVAGGAIFLTLAGLIRLNYLFISAGLVMLTFVVLASFLDVWMPNVLIRRETTSDNIFENGTMNVKFIVKNTGLGLGFVEIYDGLPPQARIIKGSLDIISHLRGNLNSSISHNSGITFLPINSSVYKDKHIFRY